jgi:hypothetical protein
MPTSSRWKVLYKETESLRHHFLPARFDLLGRYSKPNKIQAHTRAFLVLSHAEIETYLEEWAKAIAKADEDAWLRSNKVTPALAFLIATLSDRVSLPETLGGQNVKDGPQRLADSLVKLFQAFYKQIKANHGIKEKNVLEMFGPLGIPAAALPLTLLPSLDSLGTIRGTHAHHSAKAVKSVLDPEIEYKRVKAIVADLASLDQWLLVYMRKTR